MCVVLLLHAIGAQPAGVFLSIHHARNYVCIYMWVCGCVYIYIHICNVHCPAPARDRRTPAGVFLSMHYARKYVCVCVCTARMYL